MINELTLVGRVAKKDMRTIKNGSTMANLYLATTEQWTDKNGVKQEQVTWHNVNFFDKLAEIVEKYAHVGNLIYVKGKVKHQKIDAGEKQGQWAYSVMGEKIKLLPNGKKEADSEPVKPPKPVVVDAYDTFNDQIPF
jgi:single-strand DNA-binding protein